MYGKIAQDKYEGKKQKEWQELKNWMLTVSLILMIVSAVFACGCMEESELGYMEGGESELIPCKVTVPTIGLTNYRLPELLVDYGGLTYTATVYIDNPNQIPVYLDHIGYTIYMQNVSVSEGTYSEPVSIPAMDKKTIQMQDEIVIPLWGPDIQIVVGALGTGKVDTRLNGRVYFRDTEYGPLPSEPFDITIVDVPLR